MNLPLGPQSPGISLSVIPAASSVAPEAQASSEAWFPVIGSDLDVTNLRTAAFTIINSGANTLQWRIVGALLPTFADQVVVLAAEDVVAADSNAYAESAAPYRFYRVEIQDKVAGNHSTANVRGYAKG